jgi:hypothetical protein
VLAEIARNQEAPNNFVTICRTKVTARFSEWAEITSNLFGLEADGNHFSLGCRRTPSTGVEQTSLNRVASGSASFFLGFFLAHEARANDNVCLLLDEPGHSLHQLHSATFQHSSGAVTKTTKLSIQLAPFLVDAKTGLRARKVFVDSDGSTRCVSARPLDTEGNDTKKKVRVLLALRRRVAGAQAAQGSVLVPGQRVSRSTFHRNSYSVHRIRACSQLAPRHDFARV